MNKKIEVWYDETSDSEIPKWCVSLCEEDGEEIKCLSTHDDREDAVAAGRAAAEKRGLDVIERGEHGETSAL